MILSGTARFDRETVLRMEVEEICARHRRVMEIEIAPQMKELAEIVSMRPIMHVTETGYTYIFRPGAAT